MWASENHRHKDGVVKIESNIKEVIKGLSTLESKQVPFAIMNTLNDLAFAAKKALEKETEDKVDKPTPFTKKAVRVTKANKRKLETFVFINEAQAEYMQYLYNGGVEKPKNKALPKPTQNLKLNQYGNITRTKVKTLLNNKKKYFSGQPKGHPGASSGIWERYGSKKNQRIRVLITWAKEKEKKKVMDFGEIVRISTSKNQATLFRKALDHALKTAK